MQNEQTLEELGFQRNLHGEHFWRGEHVTFAATVIDCNGPVYVQLYRVSDKIDERPNSDTRGRHLKSLIKDCCSDGSVARALKQYDK
jgi:hypothetical protein